MLLLALFACTAHDDVRTDYTVTFGSNPTEEFDIPTESSWEKGEDEPGIVEDGWCLITDPATSEVVKFQLLLEVEYDPTESWQLTVDCLLDAYIAVYSDMMETSDVVTDKENCATSDSRWSCYSFAYTTPS